MLRVTGAVCVGGGGVLEEWRGWVGLGTRPRYLIV